MEQEWEFGKTNVKIEFRKYIFHKNIPAILQDYYK